MKHFLPLFEQATYIERQEYPLTKHALTMKHDLNLEDCHGNKVFVQAL